MGLLLCVWGKEEQALTWEGKWDVQSFPFACPSHPTEREGGK